MSQPGQRNNASLDRHADLGVCLASDALLWEGNKDFLLFFEPPSMDDRIVNQFALFSVMSNSAMAVDEWLFRQKGLYKRVILPKALKWEIRDKLDQSNITERVLFPGLDGLSSWLRRHYSPKG
ncbi:MAG: hypothetical protein K9L59_08730 [Desulfobacterales bacterium]|nr:hypothetical protein [Desulfobacterales bacterium]